MRWIVTEKTLRLLLWVSFFLINIGKSASAQTVSSDTTKNEVAVCLQVRTAADSAVVVRIDSATTVTLPISYVLKYKEGESVEAADTLTRYERHRQRALRRWEKLIPNQAVLQYAGSIGFLSAGIGWHYGKNDHWESEFLVGFLPKFKSDEVSSTFTLKERYVPWHCRVHRRWTIEPLTAGVFFNFIGGEDFWRRQPSRYPKSYYWFSTKVRTNIFLGQRLRFSIPRNHRLLHQAVSVYYEISTCDLYLASKFTNKDFPWSETLSLAFGVRWEM